MTVFPRRSLGPRVVTAAVFALLAVPLGAAAIGCGSSGQETAADRDRTSGQAPSGTTGDGGPGSPPASGLQREQAGKHPDAKSRPAAGGTESNSGSPPADRPEPDGGEGRESARARELCPPPLSRADCAARVKAQKAAQDGPSHPVSEPSDCLEAMSEAECRKTLAEQRAAVEASGGRSIDPETCLREYPREYCEAQLGDQYEQQQRAAAAAP